LGFPTGWLAPPINGPAKSRSRRKKKLKGKHTHQVQKQQGHREKDKSNHKEEQSYRMWRAKNIRPAEQKDDCKRKQGYREQIN
jgi:hypothetical protein